MVQGAFCCTHSLQAYSLRTDHTSADRARAGPARALSQRDTAIRRKRHMTISGRFDSKAAPMQVQVALATYINVLVNGGYEGGSPAAAYDCRAQLQQFGCEDDYIEQAIAHANKLGEEGWRKKYGYA